MRTFCDPDPHTMIVRNDNSNGNVMFTLHQSHNSDSNLL
jgi:hypothetical protein